METSKRKGGVRYREKIYFNNKEIKSPYFSRKSDAKAWKRMKLAERDKAKLYGFSDILEKRQISFKEYSYDWLHNSIKSKNSIKTFNSYESILRNHLLPTFGSKNLQTFTVKDGQYLINLLKSKGFKPKGICNIMVVFKSIFYEAERLEYILKNPMKYLKLPKIPMKVPKYWSTLEINQFLRANQNHELYNLFVVALNTGLRRGELAALKWHQIIFDRNLIEVSATRDRYGRRDVTKTGRSRFVPVNEVCRLTLLKMFQGSNSEYVFVHSDNEPLRVNHLYRHFKKAQQVAGVENVLTFHKLRDTFASHFMMNGGNIYELKDILGHTSIDMTQIYAHLSPAHLSTTTKVVSFGEIGDKKTEVRPYIGPTENTYESPEQNLLSFGQDQSLT